VVTEPSHAQDFCVVIVDSAEPRDLAATIDSLERQVGVTTETVPAVTRTAAVQAVERAGRGKAAFVTVVRAGAILLPEALRTMREALRAEPAAAVGHSYWLSVDAARELTRAGAREHVAALRERLPRGSHRHLSLATSDTLGALLTFRCDAIRGYGPMRRRSLERWLMAAARDIGLRGGIRVVPDVLLSRPGRKARPQLKTAVRRAIPGLARRVRSIPMLHRLAAARTPYDCLGELLRGWTFAGLRAPGAKPGGRHRVAYVLWRYPVPGDTFIRREILALARAGVDLVVLAEKPDATPAAPDTAAPAGPVTYFGPYEEAAGRAEIRRRLRAMPWTVIRLWLHIVRHRAGSDTTWWRDRDVLYGAAHLAALLERHGTTRVHAPWADKYALVAFTAARLAMLPFSVEARASEIHRTALAPLVADRVRFAEFIITNSRHNASRLRALLPAAAPPIHVVYEGVEIDRFGPRGAPADHTGSPRLLSVARLVEPKGLAWLLRACAALRARGQSFHCEIIGGPDPLDSATWVELRRMHTAMNLGDSVTFAGPQPFAVVLDALGRSDVFVLPSVRARDGSADVTPNSLLEAMACGLPVVSTRIGGIPEIVDHEVDGLLVPPADAQALAAAIARLLADPDLRARLGAAARRKIAERFDIDRNIERHAALLGSLPGEEARCPEPPVP
jgi:glycosyltransferase involved in cell wall biosynthesis